MRERGCFSTTTPAQPRRPRHPYAVPRTLFQYVCTRRRNCIGQLSPFSEYAPGTARFPVRKSATTKLTHYPNDENSVQTWRLNKNSTPLGRATFSPSPTKRELTGTHLSGLGCLEGID